MKTEFVPYKKRYMICSVILIMIVFHSCENVTKPSETNQTNYTGKPQIEFIKTTYDFGVLKQGEIVECAFRYKNTGKGLLKIISVNADCGCTVPEYNSEALIPGKEDKIKVIFNSEGFRNNIYKTIDVETNTETKFIELVITAFVENNKSLN